MRAPQNRQGTTTMTYPPDKGRLIRYRKKGQTEWQTSRCRLLWQYDGETIADLEDGVSIIVAFGDEWHDEPAQP